MRFCGGCGGALNEAPVSPAPAEPHAAAHRRHMTVMFCDIVGSTPLAESLDPEDFREILSGYQHACARAIERFNGYTARYLGDGVLAYFGYPRAHEDSAQRAVHAGLGILDELAALNSELGGLYGLSLKVRIGIHSGVVVAGEMGAGGTREPLAIVGETPHIAQRVESIATPGTVCISEATRDLIEGYFETESQGAQELRGVSRRVLVHRVLRPTDAVDRVEVAGARRLTPLVGRDQELAELAGAWQRIKDGEGMTVCVRGEAGIGKSRVVRELVSRLQSEAGVEEVWRCSPHHRTTPLYPVIRYLERLVGIDPAHTPAQQLDALRRVVGEAGLDAQDAVPLLADLLSIDAIGIDGAPGLPARDVRIATLNILETLLVADPGRHPLLLVVEDLHWADPTTIELLDRMIANPRRLPVLCVLTFRPDFEPSWSRSGPLVEITLGPLTSEGVRALATWASPKALDPAVLEWVASTADGVPLFVEETLKMLEHGAQLQTGRGAATAGVPSTLQGLLTERLDRLPGLGDLIDVAAVLGREFDRELLESLWPRDRADFEPALVQLAAQDVLRPVEGSPSRCEFAHALLQEAAYDRILRRHRQALHGRVASSLVSSSVAVAEREPEVVAHHWSCAAQPAKAVAYWHAAGTRALERAAFREASHHFRRGLEALDEIGPDPGDDLERVDFQTHLAASLQAAHGYASAGVGEAYAKARAGCEQAGDHDRLVPVIRGQWLFHLLRGEYGTAGELADEMLTLARQANNSEMLAEGHLYRGLVHMYQGEFDASREHLDEAFARYHRRESADMIYEAQGDTGVMALAYEAPVLWNLGYDQEAMDRSDHSLELAERVGGPVTRAQAWGMRTILHLTRGEPEEVAHWGHKTLEVSIDSNLEYWRALSSVLSAWQQGRDGDLDGGIARLEESLDRYLSGGATLGLGHFCIYLADLRLATGNREGALEALQNGERHIDLTGERLAESELHRTKGRVLTAGDHPDLDGATVAYERSVSSAREQNARLLELRAASRLAAHQRRIGDEPVALDRVAELCEWFGPDSELPDVVRARKLLSPEPSTQ
jgi:class 3 adenylate cyclase/tetratricopeptide (TPR) repeat protein